MVDLLAERDVTVDRSTIYRWVQTFGPELSTRTETPGVKDEVEFIRGLFENAA